MHLVWIIDFKTIFLNVPEERSVIKHQSIRHSILLNCPLEKEYFIFETLWIFLVFQLLMKLM